MVNESPGRITAEVVSTVKFVSADTNAIELMISELSNAVFLIKSESTTLLFTTVPENTTLSGVATMTGEGDEPLMIASSLSGTALLKSRSVSRWRPKLRGK